jgi:hypothetical protein
MLALARPDSIVSTFSNLSSDAVPSNCNSAITPTCLQALYSIPTTAAKSASNSIGVTGLSDQFANKVTWVVLLHRSVSNNSTGLYLGRFGKVLNEISTGHVFVYDIQPLRLWMGYQLSKCG